MDRGKRAGQTPEAKKIKIDEVASWILQREGVSRVIHKIPSQNCWNPNKKGILAIIISFFDRVFFMLAYPIIESTTLALKLAVAEKHM